MTTGACIHSPIQGFSSFFLTPKLSSCDETLPIINKPKHPKKKVEYKEQNGRTHVLEDNKNHLRGQTTKGTSSSQTPFSSKKHIK
jgi:hypothetical protein